MVLLVTLLAGAFLFSDSWANDESRTASGVCEMSKVERAVLKGDEELLVKLLDEGEEVDAADCEGRTPIYLAVLANRPRTIEILEEYGADLRRKTSKGETYLHVAVGWRRLESLKVLLDLHLPPDSLNSVGATAIILAVYKDDLEPAEVLLEYGANIWQKFKGLTLLHSAALKKSTKSIGWLVRNGLPADVKDSHGDTPIMYSVKNNDQYTASALHDAGSNIRQRCDLNGTLLHLAAWRGGASIVRWLVSRGLDVNAKDGFARTPLHMSAEYGKLETAEALVELDACINCVDLWGFTPFRVAKTKGHQDVAEYLHSKGGRL